MIKSFFIGVVLAIVIFLFYEYGSSLNFYGDYENSTNQVEDGFSGEDNSNVDLVEGVDKSDWTHGGLVPPNPNPGEIPPAPDDNGDENSLTSSSQGSSGIIGRPINIGNLLVAQNDFPSSMTWEQAIASCANLGNGWRLPTENELNTLYENKTEIGGFASGYYWSSTVNGSDKGGTAQNFAGGSQIYYPSKLSKYSVRAVRNF